VAENGPISLNGTRQPVDIEPGRRLKLNHGQARAEIKKNNHEIVKISAGISYGTATL